MFKSLTLTNFRKHENLHIDFEQGLIAIRGRSEAGKTTIQEAIGYAMFGVKALRQSLPEVVTYGKPEGELRVKLTLLNGTTITRSKRGAEIANTGVLCTGQNECTKWFEKLLGCNSDMAAKLMMASQNKLRGALEGGATEAAQMIESLADFDLIDRVVSLIQNKLPTGQTAALEETLNAQQAHLDDLPAPDSGAVEDLESSVASLNNTYGVAYSAQKTKANILASLDVAAARRFMVDLAAAKRDIVGVEAQIDGLQELAETEVPDPATPLEQIEIWRRELMGLKDAAARQAAYKALFLIPEPEVMWEGDAASFRAEMARLGKAIEEEQAVCNDDRARKDKAAAKRITETSCAFCGKDLTDVPEVIRRNVEADVEYQSAQGDYTMSIGALEELRAEWRELHSVDEQAHAYETAINRYAAFIIKIDDRYPTRWQWSGEPPATGTEQIDYNALIKAAENEHRAFNQAIGRRQGAQQQRQALRPRLMELQALISQAGLREPELAVVISHAQDLEREISDLGRQVNELAVELQTARGRLALAQQQVATAADERRRAAATIALSEKHLKEMQFANALLKKVRSARPYIADKLWTIVLASVSQQFSQIRGVSSVITRTDNGFKCDGQEVQGLSGSTLDSLGLAIRNSLTKTFLPNSRFMMLDEPGAACDDEREGAMLGLIAASDFDQILLVTHSAIADSFASQVVSL